MQRLHSRPFVYSPSLIFGGGQATTSGGRLVKTTSYGLPSPAKNFTDQERSKLPAAVYAYGPG